MTNNKTLKSIPEDWKIELVENLCKIGRGRVINRKELADNPGNYPVYSSQSTNGGCFGNIGSYDFDGEYVTWTTDGEYAGTTFYRNGKFNCTNVCGTLEVKERGKIDMRFLAYALSVLTQKFVVRTANPKLMNGIMAKIPVFLPPANEQKKIAEILTTVDEEIQKTDRVIVATKKFKKGLVQKILIDKFFKADAKDSISSICVANPEQINPKKEKNKLFRYIDIGSVSDGKTTTTKEFMGSEAPSRARRLVCGNDVIISTVRPNLKAFAYITDDFNNFLVSTGFCVLRAIRQISDPRFIYQVISTDQFTNYLVSKTTGSNYPAVNYKDILDFKMIIPKLSEQETIADILVQIDNEVLINKEIKEKLILLKKGLMQDLLSGKVRVKI